MRACGSVGAVVLAAAVFGLVGCKGKTETEPKPAPVTTTQSAEVQRKFLNATDCAKPEFKKDERCDWYFDPMRDSELGDKKDALEKK